MKKQMDLIITDDPVGDVKLALAKEHYDRKRVFNALLVAGHVSIVEDNDPVRIRCQIEDEIFSDERERFPSTVTMARLQLAVAAGRSCRNENPVPDHANDAHRYYEVARRRVSKSELLGMGYGEELPQWTTEDAPTVAKRVTAAVKKFAKGLRP